MCFQIPAIFTILICGPITDLIGRLKALICIPILDAIGAFIFLLNAYFITAHPAFIIPGYLVIALFGEAQGFFCLIMAFVADQTKESRDHRTSKMALAEASLALSGVFSGLSSGLFRTKLGFTSVFAFNILIDVTIFIYTLCFLKDFEKGVAKSTSETVRLINREEEEEENEGEEEYRSVKDSTNDPKEDDNNNSNNSSSESFASYFNSYFKQIFGLAKLMRERKTIVLMIISFVLIIFGVLGETLIQALYLKRNPFSLTTMEVGYYLAVQGISRFIGTVIISQVSFYCLSCNDFSLMVIGGISQILSHITIGLSKTKLEVFLATTSSFGVPLAMMSIRSVLTKKVPSNKYATVLAVLASLNVLSGLASATISTWTSQAALASSAGSAYFGLSAFAGVSVIVIIATYVTYERKTTNDE